jgi:hypothetical protein
LKKGAASERRQELSRLRRIDQRRTVAMLRRRERRYARQRRRHERNEIEPRQQLSS